MRMIHWLFSLVLCLPLLAQAASSPVPVTTFQIGVALHSSECVIIEMYQPLRQHLERVLLKSTAGAGRVHSWCYRKTAWSGT
jgi:phosphonate transport system substrate-binding protein